MAELRRITKGELQLNVIALKYGVSVAEVERAYWQTVKEEKKGQERDDVMKTIYQQGEQTEIRMKLDGSKPETVTIIYRNENELEELERQATEWVKTWQEPERG